jgi:hypothetical protein
MSRFATLSSVGIVSIVNTRSVIINNGDGTYHFVKRPIIGVILVELLPHHNILDEEACLITEQKCWHYMVIQSMDKTIYG